MSKIGQNVAVELKGNVLTLQIDLSKKGTPSASGKSVVIGTTRGNARLADAGVTVGLNVYRPV